MLSKTMKVLVIGATILMWSVLFVTEASLINLYNARMANLTSDAITTEVDNQ